MKKRCPGEESYQGDKSGALFLNFCQSKQYFTFIFIIQHQHITITTNEGIIVTTIYGSIITRIEKIIVLLAHIMM